MRFNTTYAMLFLIGLAAGCTGGYQPVSPTHLAASETPTTSLITPAITERTSDKPVTPASLDRELKDSPEMQLQRNKLVDSYMVPVVSDQRVLAAMRAVPRHSFIPTAELELAYRDYPLPIGYGQTISQPSLVAMMTEQLDLEDGDRVLEIGTGSGYQAAVLRELTTEVYTVEIIPELAGTARAVLNALGYGDIHIARRDGYFGWRDYAPYDAIIVTAAPDHLPPALVDQLTPDGGRLVIPIGPVGDVQTLWLVTRSGEDVDMQRLLDVQFVPFTRED